ncbi:MAG: hypothetical protein PT944_05470 [Actinomycetaceae bacterium]|nr:hypothetical protein [Arcanobacterium sp.]MDD7687349.1 hypothetical protein [Actinomycetaceae bacterium]
MRASQHPAERQIPHADAPYAEPHAMQAHSPSLHVPHSLLSREPAWSGDARSGGSFSGALASTTPFSPWTSTPVL